MNISIAMCTYNGDKHLQLQLDSIAKQTVLPAELIICDDNSSDSTFRVAEEFTRRAPFRVRLVRNEQNLGSLKNFEQAISLCTGELVALSDQDDIWYSQKLETLSGYFVEDPLLGGVFSDADILTEELKPTGNCLWRSYEFGPRDQARFRAGQAAEELFRRNVVTGMTMMFRSSLRDKLLPIPQSWIHDGWLAFMLLLHSKLEFCPHRLVGYRRHANQQIGPPPELAARVRRVTDNGVRAFLHSSRERNSAEYAKAATQFEDLANHLQSVSASIEVRPTWINHALAKAGFCEVVASALATTRTRRFGRILRHTKDYMHYSARGLRAMARDLII